MFAGLIVASLAPAFPSPEIVVTTQAGMTSLAFAAGQPFHKTKEKVSNPYALRLTDGTVVGFWREGSTTRHAISRNGTTADKQGPSDAVIKLKAGTFDPLKATPRTSESLPTSSENEIYIIQFKSQPLPGYLEEIRALGGDVYDTLAPNAVLVRLSEAEAASVKALGFVRWLGAYEASYRLDPALVHELDNGVLGTRRYNIWCFARGPVMQEAVASRTELLGGEVNQTIPQGYMLSATLSPVQLAQVLTMNEVCYVDGWSEPEQDMDVVRANYGANFIESTLGFTGQGVRAEVMDGGLRLTHLAWTNPPLVHAPSNVVDSHGTSTFGINFGNGTGNAAGRGMLPSAQGVIGRYSAMSGGNRYVHTAELMNAPYQCVYQSNSWGDALTTAYTTISATMDDILFLNDITILNSQSNAGSRNSRPQAWAKNIVSIGGFYHFNTASTADDRWNSGASIGPAADGRTKPDLAHFYDSVLCTTSTSDTAYTSSFGGTSAATPITAGHFGLFFQMWHKGTFGNPAPKTTVFANRPKATLAKAMMINTANQYTLPAPFDITRNVQGWGSVNLNNVYGIRNNWAWINETDVLTNLQTSTHKVLVANGTPALRLTMVYTDPKGNPAAGVARMNNLSLKVTAPNGTTIWWGNNGMSNSNWTASGGVEDTVNTVENVFIQNPVAGVYTVDVIGSDINTDARQETTAIDADFALVASGVVNGNLAPTALTIDNMGLVSGGVGDLAYSDDVAVVGNSGIQLRSGYRSVWNLTFMSPSTTASKMTITTERRNTINGIVEKIEGFDVVSGTWVVLGSTAVPTADDIQVMTVPNPGRYVAGDGRIRIKATYTNPVPTLQRPGNMTVDYARVMVEP